MNTEIRLGLLMLALTTGQALAGGACGFNTAMAAPPPQSCGYVQPYNPCYRPAYPAPQPAGYWTWRQQRVWVPGRYVPYTSPYTGSQMMWQPPHYEFQWIRSWVPTR